MTALQEYRFCFLAGLCAAGGSFFGKLSSFLKDNFYENYMTLLPNFFQPYIAFVLYQILPIALMIISNLLNWRYFLKALQLTDQTLKVTVLTAASNYIVSFILGSLVFKEPFSLLSTLGATLIVVGLWFLCGDNQNQSTRENKAL